MNRLSTIPGIAVLPYWQAKYYTPNGIREVRAIVWHFAQGGGTDSWLRNPSNNNSSHLVLKYTGAVRQMVDFDDASHSLHLSYDDDPYDASSYGIFSLTYARTALGSTALLDPNRYIIAIEVEGFYATGPNADQRRVIPILARYLEGLFPKAVHLGHRDFQDYKPCPGPTLFTNLLPHHGRLTTSEVDMAQAPITDQNPGIIDLNTGATLFDLDGKTILRKLSSPLPDRYTPYGVGVLRAIFATVNNQRRIVLVQPSGNIVRPIPAPDELAIRQAEYDRVRASTSTIFEAPIINFPPRPE